MLHTDVHHPRITFSGQGTSRVVIRDNTKRAGISVGGEAAGRYFLEHRGEEVEVSLKLGFLRHAYQPNQYGRAIMDFWDALKTFGAGNWLRPIAHGKKYVYGEPPADLAVEKIGAAPEDMPPAEAPAAYEQHSPAPVAESNSPPSYRQTVGFCFPQIDFRMLRPPDFNGYPPEKNFGG